MRVGVVWCLVVATTAFGQSRGYRYDNGGNVVEVLPLGTNANCASVGNVCAGAQRCVNESCCTPRTCQFATCDSISDGCGQVVSCGTCSATMSCVGQQCFTQATQSTAAENNATGELSVLASSQHDVEVQVQFVSSKSAYASAMVMDPRAAVQALCPINGGTDSCVNDTFTCKVCPQDPNSGSGEISCWCVNPAPLVYNSIPAGGSMSFRSNLLIDKDMDQSSDEERSSSSRIGPPGTGDVTGNVRYHEIIQNIWRYEWEDLETAPNGDFNDYIGQLTFKDCDKTLFTPTLQTWPAPNGDVPTAMSCQDGCNVSFCGDPNDGAPPDLRLAAKVMVDNANTEFDREGRGRMLTLSVVVQSAAVQDMAICPVLRVPYEPSLTGCKDVQMQEYTDDPSRACMSNRVTPTGAGLEPVCVQNVATSCKMFPVSLAREQVYEANACGSSGPYSRVGIGDVLQLGQGTMCGAQARVLDFQLLLKDVDNTLQVDSLAARGNRLLQDVDVAVDSVDLYVFDKLDPRIPFHCPSGVNVDFESYADPRVRVRKFTLETEIRHPAVDPLRKLHTELR